MAHRRTRRARPLGLALALVLAFVLLPALAPASVAAGAQDSTPGAVSTPTDLGCSDGFSASLRTVYQYGRWAAYRVSVSPCDGGATPRGYVGITQGGEVETTPHALSDGRASVWVTAETFGSTVPATVSFRHEGSESPTTWPTTLTADARPTPSFSARAMLVHHQDAEELRPVVRTIGYLDFPGMDDGGTNPTGIVTPATGSVLVYRDGREAGRMILSASPRVRPDGTFGQLLTDPSHNIALELPDGVEGGTVELRYSGDDNYEPATATLVVQDGRSRQVMSIQGPSGSPDGYGLWLQVSGDDLATSDLHGGTYAVAVDGVRVGSFTIDTTGLRPRGSAGMTYGASAYLWFGMPSPGVRHTTLALATTRQVDLPPLAGGRHVLTLQYSGSSASYPAVSTFEVDVPRLPTFVRSFTATPAGALAGSKVTLAATLGAGSDFPVDGVPVSFQRRSPTGAWLTVATGTTKNGVAKVSVSTTRTSVYRAVFAQTSRLDPATSPTIRHDVRHALTPKVTYPTRTKAVVTATVTPRARVYLQVRSGKSWKTITSALPRATSGDSGTVTFPAVRLPADRSLRLYVPTDSAGLSTTTTVIVKKRW
ncbi:hypothetical protein ACWFQT_00710 [Cellulosimicrobium cellulans]